MSRSLLDLMQVLSHRKKTVRSVALGLCFVFLVVLGLLFKEIYQGRQSILQTKEEIAEINLAKGRMFHANQDLTGEAASLQTLQSKFAANYKDGQFLVELARRIKEEKVIFTSCRALPIAGYQDYYALPLEFELVGDYNSIRTILSYLENQPNLTELRNILLTSLLPQEKAGDQMYNKNPEMTEQTLTFPSGHIMASYTLVIYFSDSGEGNLLAEEVNSWNFGRDNPFLATTTGPSN